MGFARDCDALYMILSLIGLLLLNTGKGKLPSSHRILLASFVFAMAVLVDPRLGPSLIIFILFHAGHKVLQGSGDICRLPKLLITAFWSLLPVLIAQFLARSWMPYVLFCEPKLHRSDVLPVFCTETSWPNVGMVEDAMAQDTRDFITAIIVIIALISMTRPSTTSIASFGLIAKSQSDFCVIPFIWSGAMAYLYLDIPVAQFAMNNPMFYFSCANVLT